MSTILCDITYGEKAKLGRYKMLQGDPELMKLLTNMKGEKVVIKGGESDSDSVFLCTETKTYEVRKLETTNSCLLTKRTDDPVDKVIKGMVDQTEVIERIPGDVHSQLNKKMKASIDIDDNVKRIKYSTEGLQSSLYASSAEIKEALSSSPAVEFDGVWSLADSTEIEETLESLIRLGDSLMDLQKFTTEEALEVLSEYHSKLSIFCCLKAYCNQKKENENDDNTNLWEISHQKVACSRANQLFTVNDTWTLNDFMDEWISCCPSFITPNVEMLSGNAITDGTDGPRPTISRFTASSLPSDPAKRFKMLFAKCKAWIPEDIIPYIESLIGPGRTKQKLLLRYTRSFTIKGVKKLVAF